MTSTSQRDMQMHGGVSDGGRPSAAHRAYVLSGRIGQLSIAGVTVFVPTVPAADTEVTLRLHGVGRFCGRVAFADAQRIGLRFDDRPTAVAELVAVER